jgi:Fur family transcriptional regulator, ferric uptake regulator
VSGELHETVARRLREHDQRYTRNRRAIVAVLADSPAPLTIPDILRRRRGLAQSSTYRNLDVLHRAGAVERVDTGPDHTRYELAEGLTGHHHHHLVCTACGQVTDFTLAGRAEAELDRAISAAADDHGFATAHHRLDLIGTCATCSSEQAREAAG